MAVGFVCPQMEHLGTTVVQLPARLESALSNHFGPLRSYPNQISYSLITTSRGRQWQNSLGIQANETTPNFRIFF